MSAGKANPREHGTARGYEQHRYRRELACRPCLQAAAERTRAAYHESVSAGRCATGIGWPLRGSGPRGNSFANGNSMGNRPLAWSWEGGFQGDRPESHWNWA